MGKTEILLSTAYLPPVEYMAAMVQAESVCIEAHEHYHKQTYRNRCRILSVYGPEILSIPVSKTTPNHCPIREMRISYAENWRQTHWKTFTTCYDTSPYFLYYRDYLEPFYCGKKYDFLFDFNWDLLEIILQLLKASPSIRLNETFEAQPADCLDLRNLIQPKQLSVKEYPFNNQPAYTQVFADKSHFHPHLSILDLLCNKGPDSLEYLQNWKWNYDPINVGCEFERP
ncbi:MAG: WbqC family protein [Bacteroidales bacterium]|nr:WbqC family protein [Bacteroidales bacterium]